MQLGVTKMINDAYTKGLEGERQASLLR